ncbi:sugar kinase [Cellulosilyticum lentocellum]|uniref:2-dehydro-3-deoxygluconokinase n=1 Tax=Cellulosilyticum lentocellum (strain ATCC 49066 / DSM 5427 / NCIMB 11756 / RHM5) TaxID=642492 RepID=F2JJE0_CELLD|nr:sugar kinase [Cellulosilyticum lentocellum]ADZ85535.1 2-dehydro-3-deoxygluconokinase [Cellulosilyticum lentocellum DSM 5427]
MSKVILVGEPMALFIAETEGTLDTVTSFTRSAAGAEMNVAIGLKRLEHEVCYITKLGRDPFGKYLIDFLKGEGIDTSFICFDDHYPTAFQLKGKTSVGDPDVAYYRNGSAASNLKVDDVDEIDMCGFNHFHLTGIFPAISDISRATLLYLIEKAKNNGLTTSFDPNLRPSLWKDSTDMVATINKIAFRCDTVLPGISEGKILTGFNHEKDIADFYLSHGVKNVVIKMGPKGAYVKTQTEEAYIGGYHVEKVIDTVGAGDGFAVGFISGLLENKDVRECADRANAIGALQVMHKGDNEGLPTREQLFGFMEKKAL